MSVCSSKGKLREHVLPSGKTVLFRGCSGVNCPKHGKRNRHKIAKQKLSLLVRLYKECHHDGEQLHHVTIRRSHDLSMYTFWRYVVTWLRQHRAYVVVSSSHGNIEHVHALIWSGEIPQEPAWCNVKRQYHVEQVYSVERLIKYIATNYAHAIIEFRHMATSKLTYAAILSGNEDTSPQKTSVIETYTLLRHESALKQTPQSTSKRVKNDSCLCSHCGIRPAAPHRKQCERCLAYDRLRQNNFNRRVNVNSRRYNLSESAIRRLYKTQHGNCAWCGYELPSNWQIEHVIAKCLGGTSALDNVVLSCPRCNELKGSMTIIEWLSFLAASGIEHELTPDTMPVQRPLF